MTKEFREITTFMWEAPLSLILAILAIILWFPTLGRSMNWYDRIGRALPDC